MQCIRADCPVNLLQMQVSPSVVLRGTRLWKKPGDLKSPCLSQNAMMMEHLPRSVSTDFFFFMFFLFILCFFFTMNHVLFVTQGISFTSLTDIVLCKCTLGLMLYLHSQYTEPNDVYYKVIVIFWCDLPLCLCRSNAILQQVTAGVSPVTASQ